MSDDEEFSFKPVRRTALQKENAEKLKAADQKTEDSLLQQHAQSFSDELERVDKVYEELQKERKAGWDSQAVGAAGSGEGSFSKI
mmetsp:Transcript_39213/g.91609  ORF Transcript_39213/g.91609 Transcript_39213/m.91609 type:complete len:85 (-) Transcript_39213:603-857(-)